MASTILIGPSIGITHYEIFAQTPQKGNDAQQLPYIMTMIPIASGHDHHPVKAVTSRDNIRPLTLWSFQNVVPSKGSSNVCTNVRELNFMDLSIKR